MHLRITAKADNEEMAYDLIRPVEEKLQRRFGDLIYTNDPDVTLEDAVYQLLRQCQLTVTTAESCTGGLVAGRLVNVPGISEFLQQGYITYSNEAKEKLLHVPAETLKQFGAVSPQTAEAMAKGGAEAAKADICIAITGIAGPGGGTEEKPVGLVYMSCYCKGKLYTERNQYSGSRSKVREYAVASALTLLRRAIMEYMREVDADGCES